MKAQEGSNVLSFPGIVDQGEHIPDAEPAGVPLYTMDDGGLAIDSLPFVIDEEDPLIMTGDRHMDVVTSPDHAADMRIIEGSGKKKEKARIFRLKDLHPMDCVIMFGFLILAIVL